MDCPYSAQAMMVIGGTQTESTLAQVMRALRRCFAAMPDFGILTAAARRKINTAATLPERFLDSMADTLDGFPDLSLASQLTGGEVRESLAANWEDEGIADELELLARGMRDTVALRRAAIGKRALLAYAIAKRLARGPDRELLREHLEQLRRTLRPR